MASVREYLNRIKMKSITNGEFFSVAPQNRFNEPTPQPMFRPTTGKVAVVVLPIVLCPECGCQYETRDLGDGLRVSFRHHSIGIGKQCSMSGTETIRTKAQFVQFI